MDNREEHIASLTEAIRPFLRRGDRVLICLPSDSCQMAQDAVSRCSAAAVTAGTDLRWRELLRLAFVHKVSTLIAPPLVVLGLAKLARFTGTPLYMRNVVTIGSPCADWMQRGIIDSLDCLIHDLEPGVSGPVGDQRLELLAVEINRWTSVLDCRLERGENGLEIETVVFPGEKLPLLPSCARLVLRPWDAENDIPFWIQAGWRNPVTVY